jgi:predicted lipase
VENKKSKNKQIAIFEGQKIRRLWDEKKEIWYFSVIDIVAVLTEQNDYLTARKYTFIE